MALIYLHRELRTHHVVSLFFVFVCLLLLFWMHFPVSTQFTQFAIHYHATERCYKAQSRFLSALRRQNLVYGRLSLGN